jgi:hypothetical protein
MSFDTLAQKYLRPSLIIWSEDEPVNTIAISAISRDGTKITYTTGEIAHNYSVGDKVTISGAISSGYNFDTEQAITDVSTYTFKILSSNTGETSTAVVTNKSKWDLGTNYVYVSDNNRSELAVSFERIEYKQRMINGTMRSYHVADKKNFSTSWENLPSRKTEVTEYHADLRNRFAGGQEMLKWYKDHTGDFWMLLVYDVDSTVATGDIKKNIEKVNVFFENLSYNVLERGSDLDLWNIDLSLVEV